MITVHHLDHSRSQRVLWTLEELGVPYEIRRYQRDPKNKLAPPSLLAVHPLGKSPVITDGDLTLAESGAILEYLVARYGGGRLVPAPDDPERLRYTYFMHFAEGSMMPRLLLALVFERIRSAPMPFLARPIARMIADRTMGLIVTPDLERQLDFLEGELGKSTWFAGEDLTAADVQMSYPIEAAASRGGLGERPRLHAWLERVHARPAYRRALERGGPFDLASLARSDRQPSSRPSASAPSPS